MDKGDKRMNHLSQHKNQIPLLEVSDFSLTFRQYEQGLKEVELEVIHKLDVTIYEGEIVAIVGASGSGKSLLADAILGILPKNARTNGKLNYRGEALTRKRQLALRGKEISLIPQSVHALNPIMKTGKQVQSTIKGKNKQKVQQTLFQKIGLPKEVGQQYPFELSGGMQRRILTATALGNQPNLMIADEPTPGLDPHVLHETITQMKQLVTSDKGMMFITHDIGVALQIADKIVVFNAGQTIETATVDQFSGKGEKLKHPYTKALWNALPENSFTAPTLSNVSLHLENEEVTKQSVRASHLLEVKGLTYYYPKSPVLFQHAHLTLAPGKIVGLYGPSGSGKSTMAQMISGYKKPKKGKILLGGRPIVESSVHPVQLIWQHPEKVINPRWKMRQMLGEVGELQMDLIAALGLKEDWLLRWPSELSGGELQRFCLVRALSLDIKYLIADEITTMLDAVTQAQIWHILLQVVKKRQIGMLVISHDQQLLQRVSDEVIHFSDFKE